MNYHIWGDGFDFNTLGKAESFICRYVEENSFCYLVSKEKYGTIRYEHIFTKSRLLENLYWKKILFCDIIYKSTISQGKKTLKEGIEKAVFKFPSVAAEILADSPYEEHQELNIKTRNETWTLNDF